MTRTLVPWIALAGASALVLAGCSTGAPATPEPADPGAETQPDPGGQPTDCIVGTWELIVPDYAIQAETYLLGLGIPVEGFGMDGSQVLTLTEDGLLLVETDLTSTGTLVTESIEFPFSVTTLESATAEWGWDAGELSGDGTIEIAEYRVVESETETAEEAAEAGVEPPVPALGDEATLVVDCDAQNLLLQGTGPLTAVWSRR